MWNTVIELLSQMLFLVLHVVNGSSFEKPLTAKQEREAFAAMVSSSTICGWWRTSSKSTIPTPGIRRIWCPSAPSG